MRAAAIGWRGLVIALLAVGAARAAEAPAAAPPAEGAGRLSISSQPAAEVVWEGVSLGETDGSGLLVIEGIPPGSYELELRKPGYGAQESRVAIAPGSQNLRLPLRRSPSPTPAEGGAAADSPPVAPGPALRAPGPGAEGATDLADAGEPPPEPAGPLLAPSPPAMIAPATTTPGGQPAPARSASAGPQRQDSGLSTAVWLLGLGLLTATGAAALRRRRRASARAARLSPAPQLAFQPPREPAPGPEPEVFLNDIQRREKDLEAWLEAGGDRRHADAIDVEVIDLGPAEDAN